MNSKNSGKRMPLKPNKMSFLRPDNRIYDGTKQARPSGMATLHFPGNIKSHVLPVLIIFIVAFAAYFNTLSSGFVYDDTEEVLENQWIRDVNNIPDIISNNAMGFMGKDSTSNYYRPAIHLIFMFNYHVFGLKPWGFHLINILFHASVSALVFIIASKLLGTSSNTSRTKEEGLAGSVLSPPFIGAFLFAVHPVHTEAVAWVAALPDIAYTLFALLSLFFHIKFNEGTKGMYPLSLASFSLAVFCKEPALTLPIILAAYDSIFEKSADGYLPLLKRYIPYLLVAGVYLGLRFHALGGFSPQKPNIELSAGGYLINVFPLFIKYLEYLVLPLNLNAFHVLRPVHSLLEPTAIAALIATAAFIIIIFISFRKNSRVCFSLLVIVLPLLPPLYIAAVGENVFAERYLYLPSVGFVLLAATTLSWARSVKPELASGLIIISIAAAGVYSIGTVGRNTVWKDDLTLFADMVTKSPDAATPHNNLGDLYLKQNRLDEAEHEFIAALKLKPSFAMAHNNLGYAYLKQYRLDEAVNEFTIALKLYPGYAEAHNNLGAAYLYQNRFDEARNEFNIVLEVTPNNPIAGMLVELCNEKMKEFEQQPL